MNHIVILTHQHEEFSEISYVLKEIAEVWRERGMRVTVLRGVDQRMDADLAILHVDLTVIPDEYLEFMKRYPIAINGFVKDISKRKISANIVNRRDGYQGPVMIKTDLNCGGAAEGAMAQKTSLVQKYIRAIRRRLHWSMRAELGMWDYPVLDSVKKVPRAVWRNSDLVVERFLPERQDGFYVMRSWLFCGEAEENRVIYANQPIVKSPVAVRIEVRNEIPDELRRMRQKLGFDFGKFDYGIVNGRVVLYDANRTPVGRGVTPESAPVFKLLASGIDAFLKPRLRAAG